MARRKLTGWRLFLLVEAACAMAPVFLPITPTNPLPKKNAVCFSWNPPGTINTGDAGGELTAEENVWI